MRRAIAGAAGVMLLAAGCTERTAIATSWQFADVDHVVSGAATLPISGAGPAPGVISEQWRVDNVPAFDHRGRLPEFHVAGGAIIVATPRRVDAYDASTGAKLWHYREPGREMLVGATNGTSRVVVIASENPDDDSAGRLVGLDAGTGRMLWARHNRWRVGTGATMLTVADGTLPVLAADVHHAHEVTGLDVRTGQVAWVTGYDRCKIANLDPPRRSDASLIIVHDCGFGSRLQAFDPATGQLLWTKTWPTLVYPHRVTVRDRTVLIRFDTQLVRIGPDGTTDRLEIDPLNTDDPIGFYLPVYTDLGSKLIDVHTGQTVSTGWPALLASQVPTLDAHNVLYVLDPYGPVPGLVTGDPAQDQLTWLPMPGSEPVDGRAVWAAAAGGRLLLARQHPTDPTRVRLFAYASQPTDGPAELGGLPHERWPDPCDLQLSGATGTVERLALEPLRLGRVEVPHRACRLFVADPHHRHPDAVDIHIIWVGAEPRIAKDWLAGEPGPPGIDEVIDGGYFMTARVGPVILELRGYRYADLDLLALLEQIADQLTDP